jgi:putative addiction module component (TIGR02574 family)
MSTQLERLAIELLGLPNSSRALLATKLLESLDETETSDPQAAWIAVAERRAKELEEGVVQGIPAEEVMSKLRRKLATSRDSE